VTSLRILVSGMMAADPHQGGATWAVLQYVLGLRALGHDVYFVEPVAPASLKPAGAFGSSSNARYFDAVTARFDLDGRAALLLSGAEETVGLPYRRLVEIAARCDVLLNVSGMLTDPRLIERIPSRVYLDLDPAFNQLWHAVEGIDMRLAGHTHFVTVGRAIGDPGNQIPTCGVTWLPTFQPVLLEEWPATPGDPAAAWTTVGNWRGYGSIHHAGVFYGQKAHSLRRVMDLPGRTTARLEVALAIDSGEVNDLESLHLHGWHITDPVVVAGSPDRYRQFIQESKGELAIAKSGYVESECGWFSDRSACYLASGRPVVAQETGFSRFLPTGKGLVAFGSIDEAVDGLDAMSRDYATHCRHAREIAEQHFRAEDVLGRLLHAL
jgi:hypothetical protein